MLLLYPLPQERESKRRDLAIRLNAKIMYKKSLGHYLIRWKFAMQHQNKVLDVIERALGCELLQMIDEATALNRYC